MHSRPLVPVTDEQVSAYERDGAVHLPGLFDHAWVDYLLAAVAIARTRPGPHAQDHAVPGEGGGFQSDLYMSRRVPEFLIFARESPAGAIAARLMRSRRVNFLHDAMWLKEPGTSRRTPWHHDQPFYCMEGDTMCVVWLPLDAHSKEISLGLLRGSHRWGKRFRPERINGGWYEGYGEGDGFEPAPEVDLGRDERVLRWDVRPGDCIAFHGLTMHGAPGNHSAGPRRAVSLVLVGDDAVYVERGRETQPRYEGHGLSPGDPIDCEYFPRIFPRA